MKKAGVIGHPIAHSLSPKLHNYWLKKYNINGEYKAYDVAPAALADFIGSMVGKNFSGCNITVPHKEAALRLIDDIDPLAEKIGAINTLIVRDGKISGSNTDVVGFSENIKPHITGTKKAVILGAGGASRAVIVALQQLGFSHITITNRTREKSLELAKKFTLETATWEHRADVLQDADLLVNTTSLGLAGKSPLEIDLALLPKSALVTDIVYAPLITPLLDDAQARGNKIVDGLGMLLHQAAPGFAAWFGVKPEVTNELRQFILAA